MEILIAIVSGSVGSGVMAIALAYLNRKWAKEDKKDERIDALVNAQKVMMIDRVNHIAKCHIATGEISLDEKNQLIDMHKAYKRLGGNGHLDLTMNEINKLKVVS